MSNPLDYQPPEPSSPGQERVLPLRILAGGLAIAATAWAVFGTISIIEDETWRHGPWRTLLVFGSSYVVVIGLGWRTLGRPSPNGCRAIWAVSALVQGAWLTLIIIETFFGRGGGGGVPGLLFMIAFAGSTFVSLVGLVLEPSRPARQVERMRPPSC